MYFTEGKNKVLNQFEELLKAADPDYLSGSSLSHLSDSISSHINEKEAYKKFLHLVQPTSPSSRLISNDKDDLFLRDSDKIKEVTSYFTGRDQLTDLNADLYETPKEAMNQGLQKVEEALQLLKLLDKDLYDVFRRVIHTVFYNRSLDSGGGSVSSLIGVIWCCNRKSWSTWDVLELLIHELTHNLVFLDEYYHVHYHDLNDVVKKENYAHSAILSKKRPLDKVFHSIIVGYEIINFREKYGENLQPKAHPSTTRLRTQVLAAIEDTLHLLSQKKLATNRVHELLHRIEESLREDSSIKGPSLDAVTRNHSQGLPFQNAL